MSPFDMAAVLLAIAAAAGYVNHRLLRLPATTGTLAVALLSSLIILAVEARVTGLRLQEHARSFLDVLDFNETVMRGFLSFLLFAGALHVDLEGLWRNKWTIGVLSTVGVLISTVVVGCLLWGSLHWLGMPVTLMAALVFGALISPTDPIAVMGLLRELRAPADLEAQIAGESLFNDGIGVVVFLVLLSQAGLGESGGAEAIPATAIGLLAFLTWEVVGAVALGLAFGYVAFRALKSLNEHSLELLITLALVMVTYATSFRIHVSGPIAVVVAGLLIGNPGRRFAMSTQTREHVDAFWGMLDYILNAVLFLLIALEVFGIPGGWLPVVAGLVAVPIALVGRAVSVALPVLAMRRSCDFGRGLIPILTWTGLRGGISVAMALSLPHFAGRDYLLAATYSVVVFSVLVQGLTVRRLLLYYQVSEQRS